MALNPQFRNIAAFDNSYLMQLQLIAYLTAQIIIRIGCLQFNGLKRRINSALIGELKAASTQQCCRATQNHAAQ